MLAAPLLRVAVRKGMIVPLFCTRNDELELAKKILEEFQESCKAHEKKSELYNRISAIESSHNDYKLVRGFCALLERRCTFNAYSYARSMNTNNAAVIAIDPVEVRRMLFEESAKRGFGLTDLERNSIIDSISEKLHISSDYVTRAMWSDLDDNLIFEHFGHIDAETLVGWYNLALMQTLLFNATKMEFHISGGANWKRILRNVKRLGLMYYLENRHHYQQQYKGSDENNNNDSIVCSLEGPLSLFKLTDRYGTSLAKLLPSIVLAKQDDVDWQIDAWVLRKTMTQGKKLYQFKMSNGEAPPFLTYPFYTTEYYGNNNDNNNKKDGTMAAATVSLPSFASPKSLSPEHYFDSMVEEKFARKFNEVAGEATGWKLIREPDPLIVADGKAFIPDFMFEKYGRRVYLEIVGFWTPEYLERKLQKVKHIMKANSSNNNGYNASSAMATIVDMFIAVNEDLAGSKISSSSSPSSSPTHFSSSVPVDKLILYKNDSVPIRPILDYLKVLDKEMIERKTKDPNFKIEIDRSKDLISLEDIAQEYDLPIEVVSKVASRDYNNQYISIGGGRGGQQFSYYLISRPKAEKLESLLKGVSTFADACLILSKNAIPEACHAELVEKLGYEVTWRSMDIGTAVIQKKNNKNGA